jgi:hypothetical protein
VAPTRQAQAAAQAQGAGQLGLKRTLGWAAGGKGKVGWTAYAGEGRKPRGHRQTSLDWAAKAQRRRRAASGAELEEEGWAKKKRKRVEGGREPFQNFKTTQTNEFKPRFEFKHSKQCTSMYATVNSYISLINYEK